MSGPQTLPLPAVSFQPPKRKKHMWARVKRQLGVASLPSESLADISGGETMSISDRESSVGTKERGEGQGRRMASGDGTDAEDDAEVEAIVVENELSPDQWIKEAPVLSEKGTHDKSGSHEGAPSIMGLSMRSIRGGAGLRFVRNRVWPALCVSSPFSLVWMCKGI